MVSSDQSAIEQQRGTTHYLLHVVPMCVAHENIGARHTHAALFLAIDYSTIYVLANILLATPTIRPSQTYGVRMRVRRGLVPFTCFWRFQD